MAPGEIARVGVGLRIKIDDRPTMSRFQEKRSTETGDLTTSFCIRLAIIRPKFFTAPVNLKINVLLHLSVSSESNRLHNRVLINDQYPTPEDLRSSQ